MWTTELCLLNEPPNHWVSFPVYGCTLASGGPVIVKLPLLTGVMLEGGYSVSVAVPVNVVVNHPSCALLIVLCSTPLPVPTIRTKSVDRTAGHPAVGGSGGATLLISVKWAVSEHGPGCVLPHAKFGAVSAPAACAITSGSASTATAVAVI